MTWTLQEIVCKTTGSPDPPGSRTPIQRHLLLPRHQLHFQPFLSPALPIHSVLGNFCLLSCTSSAPELCMSGRFSAASLNQLRRNLMVNSWFESRHILGVCTATFTRGEWGPGLALPPGARPSSQLQLPLSAVPSPRSARFSSICLARAGAGRFSVARHFSSWHQPGRRWRGGALGASPGKSFPCPVYSLCHCPSSSLPCLVVDVPHPHQLLGHSVPAPPTES